MRARAASTPGCSVPLTSEGPPSMSDPGRTNPAPGDVDASVEMEASAGAIVKRTVDELTDDSNLSKPTRLLAQSALRGLKGLGDYERVIANLDRLTYEISMVNVILERCTKRLRAKEKQLARRSPGSDFWWKAYARDVSSELRRDSIEEALRRWISVWLDGLAMRDWGGCRRFLDL